VNALVKKIMKLINKSIHTKSHDYFCWPCCFYKKTPISMARSRYTPPSRRSNQGVPNLMGEMFQKTPWWVWIIVLVVLVLLWKFQR
jgi:hypothetical protein